MQTHLELSGVWAVCPDLTSCALLFHFPDVTPEQMVVVPEPTLWELTAIIQPPTRVTADGTRR